MQIFAALKSCLYTNYFNIHGVASRSEFWWMYFWLTLFSNIVGTVLYLIEDNIVALSQKPEMYFETLLLRAEQPIRGLLYPLFLIYLVTPLCTLSARRWREFGGNPFEGFFLSLIGGLMTLAGPSIISSAHSIPASTFATFWAIYAFLATYYFASALRVPIHAKSETLSLNPRLLRLTKVEDIISKGESEYIEFKETWHFDIRQSEETGKKIKNSGLKLACIKTVAAFLNSKGGVLLIGVRDNGELAGLERDCSLLTNSEDRLYREIATTLSNSIGIDKKFFYSVNLLKLEGKTICRILVQPQPHSKTWVNFKGEKSDMFYIRNGNQTEELSGGSADSYWEKRIA